MGLFDKFKKTQELSVQVESPVQYIYVSEQKYRIGMWAMTSEGVGIVVESNKVVLVNEDGGNKMVIVDDKAVPKIVDVDVVVQADIEDIPSSRRQDVAVLYTLGYKHKEAA